jgi:histone H3/H4
MGGNIMTKKNNSFLKLNTIKTYIKEKNQMRSNKKAIENLIEVLDNFVSEMLLTASKIAKKEKRKLDNFVSEMLLTASKIAKKEKRNTILQEDIDHAIESHLKTKALSWEEISDLIIKQNPTNIGKISNKINNYVASKEKKE